MNRRRFLQSVAALVSIPALPTFSFSGVSAASASAVAVPAKARFWAIYMSALHGECTPQSLESILNIPATDAKKYVTKLVADGVIKPNPILKTVVKDVVKGKKDNLLDRFKKRIEKKSEARVSDVNAIQKPKLFEKGPDNLDKCESCEMSYQSEPLAKQKMAMCETCLDPKQCTCKLEVVDQVVGDTDHQLNSKA